MHDITSEVKLYPYYRHKGTIFNCLVMEYQENKYFLLCGLQDTVNVFICEAEILVLSVNECVGCIGLSRYVEFDSYPISRKLLIDNQEVKEVLGIDPQHMEPADIVTKLIHYLY